MAKIDKQGSDAVRPPINPESAENIKEITVEKEPAQPAPTSLDESALKQPAGDKYAVGDLKTAGDRMKSQLISELDHKVSDTQQDIVTESLAAEAEQIIPRFSPPYTSGVLGSVEPNDRDPVLNSNSQIMNLRADQFQINEQGNLVITNENLIEYFKSLKESGKDILLGITNLKTPADE